MVDGLQSANSFGPRCDFSIFILFVLGGGKFILAIFFSPQDNSPDCVILIGPA